MEEQKKTEEELKQVMSGKKGDKADVEKNKVMAIIGYIIPLLFFVPLITDAKDSEFAKYHANQQLVFLIFATLGFVISAILMVILIGFLLYFAVLIASFIFMILGIVNAAKGEMNPLPIIGGIEIIK